MGARPAPPSSVASSVAAASTSRLRRPDLGIRILGADDFALFRNADLSLHGAAGLRQDRLVRRAATAADRAAAAMEQPHADAVPAEGLDEFGLCLEQLPARRQVAAVLVAVGIPEHHFLRLAPRVEHARVHRNRQQRVHRAGRVAQVRDRLEQRDDVAAEVRVRRTVEADLAQQQHHLEHVGHAVALRDHVVGNARGAVALVHARGGLQDREFAAGFRGILDVRRAEQSRRRQFLGQHAARGRLRPATSSRCPAAPSANSSATTRWCTSEFWRMSTAARWKPNTSTARRRRRRRPRASRADVVRFERATDDVEVGRELGRVGIRRGVADRVPQRLVHGPGRAPSRRSAHTGP